MDKHRWYAKGILFENCSCQLICPAHVSFRQKCNNGRCIGHWSIHVKEGDYEGIKLDGLNAVILYDTPEIMFEGGWKELIFIDEQADKNQRGALIKIFSGNAGGPWKVLARFVSEMLEPRYVPIKFIDDGREKKMLIDGIFDSSITAIRGKDKSKEAVLSNMFNQIHDPVQVLAFGETSCMADNFSFFNKGTHGLYSNFNWKVAGE